MRDDPGTGGKLAPPAPPTEDAFHLGRATEDELRRLAVHPVREAERLRERAASGDSATGLWLLVAAVALVAWLLAALMMVAVFLVAHLVV